MATPVAPEIRATGLQIRTPDPLVVSAYPAVPPVMVTLPTGPRLLAPPTLNPPVTLRLLIAVVVSRVRVPTGLHLIWSPSTTTLLNLIIPLPLGTNSTLPLVLVASRELPTIIRLSPVPNVWV